MSNPFLDAINFKFIYECKGETIELSDEQTEHEAGRYFVVLCDKCCNIPVFHLLRQKE